MLRQNKSLIIKAAIFVGILIFGAVWLLARGNEEDEIPYYGSVETPAPDEELTGNTYPPVRQPIVSADVVFDCNCPHENSQPIRNLAALRPRHQAVEPVAFVSEGSTSLLLEADGSLWTWGGSWSGRLGVEDMMSRNVPGMILDSVVYLSAQGNFAIRGDGSLWGWGLAPTANVSAWFGDFAPVYPRLIMEGVFRVVHGDTMDYAIGTDGSLWAIGQRRPISYEWQMTNAVVPQEEPIFLLNSVVEVFSAGHTDFILQCNGRLWYVRGDDPAVHFMDEVATVYIPPAQDANISETHFLIQQTDGSLWYAILSRGQMFEPNHLLDDVVSVYRGYGRIFIITSDNVLWAMGSNIAGGLGVASAARVNEPTRIMSNVAHVIPRQHNTFAITTGGDLWGWGINNNGQLGIGSRTRPQAPIRIMRNVKSIDFSSTDTFVLDTGGQLWGWGSNMFHEWPGYEGDFLIYPVEMMADVNSFYTADSRVYVIDMDNNLWEWHRAWGHEGMEGPFITKLLEGIRDLFVGTEHVTAFKEDGSVWGWGVNWDGQVGDGSFERRQRPVNISYSFSYAQGGSFAALGDYPTGAVPLLNRQTPFIITGGNAHFLVNSNLSLWSWGDNWNGQLGQGIAENWFEGAWTPGHVMDGVVDVHSNDNVVYALGADGRLWVWGDRYGTSPVHVMSNVAAFYSDQNVYFALRADGTLWHWSYHPRQDIGEIVWWDGEGEAVYHTEPTQIMENVRSFYMQSRSFFALSVDGSLLSWGLNADGVLGDGSPPSSHLIPWDISLREYDRLVPEVILEDVARFYLSDRSAFAILTNGSLWAWGRNDTGQLGANDRQNHLVPIRIMDGVQDVFVSGASTFATRADGSIWAWGLNIHGQLGDGTQISRLSPVPVTGLPQVRLQSIEAIAGTTYAILDDDNLWVWGADFGVEPIKLMDGVAEVYRDNAGRLFVLQLNGDLLNMVDPNEPELIMRDVAGTHIIWGEHFTINNSGEVWSWGHNWHWRWENDVDWNDPRRIF
ncbi:MAG: hypothetical protein FWE11_07655 [Defluviitaleaceae bacterium]|nr:hypothetical protein [Defluviitaleaceae bacterium]